MDENKKFMSFLFVCLAVELSLSASAEVNGVLNNSPPQPVDLRVDVLDDHIPEYLKNALVNAVQSKNVWLQQYSESLGIERLRQAIATFYSKRINIPINPQTDVLVTVGATEALHSTFHALTNPGDEWIVIEPFWLKFYHVIELAKGVPRFTNLKLVKNSHILTGNDFILDRKELEGLFNNKTKGILLNNPNNPSGKVYPLEDLQFIAHLSQKYNTLVISDEVYQHVVYDAYKHISIASLPGMFQRTITIGSASKSFGVSGWRIGWLYAPSDLIQSINKVHNLAVQNSPTPSQDAIAYALELEEKSFGGPGSFLTNNLHKTALKRNSLVTALRASGLIPIVPNGGHCMTVYVPSPRIGSDNITAQSYVEGISGVQGYPLDLYYSKDHAYIGYGGLRVCFQKSEATIRQAVKNLERLKNPKLTSY